MTAQQKVCPSANISTNDIPLNYSVLEFRNASNGLNLVMSKLLQPEQPFFKDEEEDDAKEMEEIKPSASSMPTVRGRSKTMPASVMPLFNSHF